MPSHAAANQAVAFETFRNTNATTTTQVKKHKQSVESQQHHRRSYSSAATQESITDEQRLNSVMAEFQNVQSKLDDMRSKLEQQ